MFGLSPWKDVVVVLLIVLLFFGPKRLPALSRSIGESIKEFKGGITHHTSDSEEKSELTGSTAAQEAPTSSAPSEHTNV
jgi:sec-independent protein translocase protein TatA